MRKGPPRAVEDVDGPWRETPGPDTGLVQRCRKYWAVPVEELPNQALATYLRQNIAVSLIAREARRRIDANYHDDSELYDEELANALRLAENA